MSINRTMFELFFRNFFYIGIAGFIFGALYTVLALIIQGYLVASATASASPSALDFIAVIFLAPFGGLIGSGAGFLAGFLNGILTTSLTLTAFYPPTRNRSAYEPTIRIATVITTMLTTFFLLPIVISWLFPGIQPGIVTTSFNPWLIPTAVAGIGSYVASGRITRWYLKQFALPTTP